jgi:succinate dehydrogenase / fumarate reductase cytochrome b subunit
MVAPTQERRMERPVPPRRPAKQQWPWPLNLYQTAVGKKWVMALTGLGLVGFVVAHLAGNLKMYMGAEDIYKYGEFLRDMGEPIIPHTHLLWILRIGLLAMFGLHIHAAVTLTRLNAKSSPKANPVGEKQYEAKRDYIAANFASRTMRWTGTIIGLYVLFHLADLTYGNTGADFVKGDVYNNMVNSMSRPLVALIYIVANVALAIHLFHGFWSMFQTLGINNPRYNGLRRNLATAIAGVILIGNLSFPILIVTGVIDNVEPDYLTESMAVLGLV